MDNLANRLGRILTTPLTPRPQARRWRHRSGLILLVVAGLSTIAFPGHSGSAPSGASSGVTVSGSSILPLGASPLGEERIIESTTPNATVNRATGEVLLTAAAQQSLNQSASSVLQGLEVNHPALASLITTPGTIDLDSSSLATTLAIADEVVEPEETIGQLAARAAAAINADNSFSLNGDLGSLGVEPPSADPGTTSAVFIPTGGTPVVIPLSGSRSQIANTAAFLTAAFASGISPLQANLFTSFALAGVDYRSLVPLFNAAGGLLPKVVGGQQPSGLGAIAVDATQMESAIQAYNAILASSDAATLAALAQNSDFVALGRSLQQLRAAIE